MKRRQRSFSLSIALVACALIAGSASAGASKDGRDVVVVDSGGFSSSNGPQAMTAGGQDGRTTGIGDVNRRG